jgi:hypothetical protein
MEANRREFLFVSGTSAAAAQLRSTTPASNTKEWNAQWIWYPGQLAAYRHSRRVRLAMNRCR